MLSQITDKNKTEEIKIQQEINSLLENNSSFIFEAGAGAGKTYALKESLKFVLEKFSKTYREYNQKILCITYTNVAKEKIQTELGVSEIIEVSTIHEKLWEIISPYQEQLMKIHKKKLEEEVIELENMIESDTYNSYNNDEFKSVLMEQKEVFYNNYTSLADDFKKIFEPILDMKISNVASFRKFVNYIYKLENYNLALSSINAKTVLKYDARNNRDIKHKMIISHDSLLEYSYTMVSENTLLKKIIIDKYPIIMVDEYQDTDEYVIQILDELYKYKLKNDKLFLIAFFGDCYQKIYRSGIGKIDEIKYFNNFGHVFKKYNRRSTKEIIDVCNKIRNSKDKLESIYCDSEGGKVEFAQGGINLLDEFINNIKINENIDVDNKLTCMLLTNAEIAKKIGLDNIYQFYRNADIYTGSNFDKLNQELLTSEKNKMGSTQKFLYNIVELKYLIQNQDTYFKEIVPVNKIKEELFETYKEFVGLIKKIKGETFFEYINSLFEIYEGSKNYIFKVMVDNLFSQEFELQSKEGFNNSVVDFFHSKLFNEQNIDNENKVKDFLKLDIKEFMIWFNYVNNNQIEDVQYYTYHGTKGLEFENVLVVMGNAFGRDREYFDFYFKNLNNYNRLNANKQSKMEEIRNLLYVVSSRAIKNLYIYYTDDTSDFEDGISQIFGNVLKLN